MGRFDNLHGDEDEIEFELSHKKIMRDFMTVDEMHDDFVITKSEDFLNVKDDNNDKPGE